jgi:hypothetical protein
MIAFLGVLAVARPVTAAEYRVPLMAQPPVIDGQVQPEEWRLSAGFDGFAFNGQLERRRVRAYVAATEGTLYFAFRSQLPDEGELVAQVAVDTVKIVYDDSLEVWVDPTPGSDHGKTYQMLANPAGRCGWDVHPRGNEKDEPAWRGDWQVASGFHEGEWQCEVAVPLAGIAPGRTADQGEWGINLCRNWKNPWAFSSTGGGPYAPEGLRFTFAKDALPIRHETSGDPFLGEIDTQVLVTNPGAQPAEVKADLKVSRDVMPELAASETLTLAPGESKAVALKTSDASTKRFTLSARVTSADGQRVLYERSYAWQRGEPWKWTTAKPEVLPIDFQFGYYPYLNRMRVLADVSNLSPEAKLKRLVCAIRKKGAAEPLKTIAFEQIVNGRQEQTFDLPPLDGSYEIAMRAEGEDVPPGELVKPFERTVYEWEHQGLGAGAKVYPPFTPIEVQGRRVSTVLREHTMNDQGLWDQVTAAGQPLLAQPMSFLARVDGQGVTLKSGPLRFTKTQGNEAVAKTRLSAEGLSANATCTWDYDGMMRVDLELQPNPGHKVEGLVLSIPLRREQATLFHAMGDGIRNTLYEAVPKPGQVWDSTKVAVNDLPRSFCSYLFVGTPKRGLCWFAENDRGWSWDPKGLNVAMETGEDVQLSVHLISDPIEITASRTITFGLQAAPVKPMLGDWRYRWVRSNYTLLGTDINWFALGDCGSVYPAHKDLALWEALKRGNTERLSDEDVQKVIDRGRPYFEPYGADRLESWGRHVGHNLRARYGKKMVLYYNRASFQLADEFQTFQDEWGMTDYRTVGPGNGIWEIKVVPTDSYIDHALYWYGKAFDVAGSQGVYWDNWFFAGSYNTAMTGAYARPDGSVAPSTGLWGLRELAKRTFQYMNERGMTPVTMAHMTSTNILPLLSFCTVQYDWEWKYSEGDVQYRFPREYILLVSNGELAGTWPVLLGDHGNLADDPWTQRTFAGVCLVHELDCWGRQDVWEPLFKPVHELLDTPSVEVYRYWDERPQPVVADSPDLPTIVYSLKGKQALVGVTSYAETDLTAQLTIDPASLGLAPGYGVTDAVTGEALPVQGNTVSFPLRKHDVRELRIEPEVR